MGTSQSSKGPGSNVPMVPPWVDDLPPEEIVPPLADDLLPGSDVVPSPTDADQVAPSGRFTDARRNLGSFVSSGSRSSLQRGLAHYVRSGYGGSGTMTRRLAGTARTASTLDSVLRSGLLSDGRSLADVQLTASGDANVLIDAIVDASRSVDGTQDAEASRRSVAEALSDLLAQYPEANMAALDDEQREFVVERFSAMDVYARFLLDMQATVMEKAGDIGTAMTRLRQVKEFIQSTVQTSFRAIREAGVPTAGNVAALTRAALAETFRVFESYL